jgi:hypothetical protein
MTAATKPAAAPPAIRRAYRPRAAEHAGFGGPQRLTHRHLRDPSSDRRRDRAEDADSREQEGHESERSESEHKKPLTDHRGGAKLGQSDDLAHEQLGVERLKALADGGEHTVERAREAGHEVHIHERSLSMRKVDRRRRLVAWVREADVATEPDDLHFAYQNRGAAAEVAGRDSETLSKRASLRERISGETLIDDDHARCVWAIVIGELPAGDHLGVSPYD